MWRRAERRAMAPLYEETTTTAAERLETVEVALLPTGSTEQHGPALPLGTDFLAAEALAYTATDRPDVTVLPTIPVGVSEHHRQFDGTLWTDPETFERYVGDVLSSIASHGVHRAVIVNGHGGNSDALRRAARNLRNEGVLFAVPWNWWESVGDEIEALLGDFGGHADQVESSMMLSVAEDLVRTSALAEAEESGGDSWGHEVHGANVGFDAVDFTESGAVGRPTEASVETGEELFDAASRELHGLIDWLADRDLDSLSVRPHK